MRLPEKCSKAKAITHEAGELALSFFRQQDSLRIDRKGHQDFVSQADREVELLVRQRLAEAFPGDGIVGEEHAPTKGSSGFTWVIDPIDGTTNFINGIPAWTVVLAGVSEGQTRIGITHDPIHKETYVARRGAGAWLNDQPLQVQTGLGLRDGSIGVGFSNRVPTNGVANLVRAILDEGGVFSRNASGALALAYVAAGRLLGYAEEHMNAWDCLAGQLLVTEAGGGIEVQDADRMIADGGRVIVGEPGVFDDLVRIANSAFAS